ncbi:F-box protein, partial [Neochlamydia sp. AcF95]
MNIENPNLPLVVFPEFKEIEKRNLSFSQGPYAEISLQIFAKLRSVDLCRARLVCKEWKKLIQQANLWKELHPGSCRINSPKEKQQGAEIYLG